MSGNKMGGGNDTPEGDALRQRIWAVFDGRDGGAPLAESALALLARQKDSWPALARACADLDGMRRRTIACGGFSVSAQFNPRRLASSAAAVDPASLARRPCFLCPSSLPAEQEAILYRGNYLVLCNPAPVFPAHFTIVHRRHIPQALAACIPAFLDLAADLAPCFTVFYNGPRCGASAPDHLHFQAVPRGVLPIEEENAMATAPPNDGSGRVRPLRLKGLGREAWVLAGRSRAALEESLLQALAALARNAPPGSAPETEPMVNLLATFRDGAWRVILFPRAKHRSAAFSREGEDGLLITPAAIEMSGVFIAPRERDYGRLDGALVCEIYKDVSIDAVAAERAWREIAGGSGR